MTALLSLSRSDHGQRILSVDSLIFEPVECLLVQRSNAGLVIVGTAARSADNFTRSRSSP